MPRGYVIIALGLLYAAIGNRFFGDTLFPVSAEELIFDGLLILIIVIGIACLPPRRARAPESGRADG